MRDFRFFMSYYMRDDKGDPFAFQEFHTELMEACADTNQSRLLALEPASFGKSTIVAKGYPIWLICCNPNVRVALGGKTFDDATRRLRTIKAEMESNALLIEDFGPFKGDVWKEDQIEVLARKTKAKESNITCFGSETNVFGWRADVVILDDIVTNENSGPQVKPATRERLRDNFFQGISKLGVVGEPFLIRWVNTVVDMRDLTHEVGQLKLHPDMQETKWKTPSGWLVLRRSAINELTGEPLWGDVYPASRPEGDDRPSAEKDKALDILTFLKRMQNRCIEPELMTFQEEWIRGAPGFPGCLDHDRQMGVMPPGWTSAGGFDPAAALNDKADYCGHVVVAFDKNAPEPRVYNVIWIDKFRAEVEDQAEKVISIHARFNSAKTKIEANAAQQWLLALKSVKDATSNPKATPNGPMRIEKHFTGAANKPDPEIGIPSLAGMVKMGLLRFPMGDATSKRMSDLLIGEMLEHPMGHSGDLLMALWFAILAARESQGGRLLKIVRRPLPQWAAFGRVA